MKILMFLICVVYFSNVQPKDAEQKLYCESCLTAAKEIEKALQDCPSKSRQGVIKKLIRGAVCEKLSEDKRSSCKHLLGVHQDQFYETLLNKDPKKLDIVLCYEQSTACVGVKLHTFQDSRTFLESDIEALLHENKENVRIVKPTHSGSPVHSKEEL